MRKIRIFKNLDLKTEIPKKNVLWERFEVKLMNEFGILKVKPSLVNIMMAITLWNQCSLLPPGSGP